MEYLTIFTITSVFAFFDIDRTFTLPKDKVGTAKVVGIVVVYLFVNFLLCCFAYFLALNSKVFNISDELQLAFIVSLSFPLLLKSKFITLTEPGSKKKTPIGLDMAHESMKNYIYKQINIVAKRHIEIELKEEATQVNLIDLVGRAKRYIMIDSLFSEEQRTEDALWVKKVLDDTSREDLDKKVSLLWYLRSGRKAAG